MKAVTRSEAIELLIPAGSTASRFNFLDIPQLRSDVTKDIIVQAIKCFTADEKSVDFNGNPVATLAQVKNAELTLYVDGDESIFRVPLTTFMNSQNFDVAGYFFQPYPDEYDNLMIDWTKSYITADVPFANETAFVFLFQVQYKRFQAGTMARIKAARGDSSNLPGVIMS